MRSLNGPVFRFLMRLQGIGDPTAVSKAELNAGFPTTLVADDVAGYIRHLTEHAA